VELDLVDAAPEPIERPQLRAVLIGGGAQREGFGVAQARTELGARLHCPFASLAAYRRGQPRIRREQIVLLERLRDVEDLVGRQGIDGGMRGHARGL
jgi:hypothetical protein